MVQVNFNLWRPENIRKKDLLTDEPIFAFTDFDINRYDPNERTYVITHGFINSGGEAPGTLDSGGNFSQGRQPEKWILEMAYALRERDPKSNIILVDWQEGAKVNEFGIGASVIAGGLSGVITGNLFPALPVTVLSGLGIAGANYLAAADNTVEVGKKIAEFLKTIDAQPEKTELIGHSLGAQASGSAGFYYQQIEPGKKINRITGLDPAGPIFELELNENVIENYLLDKSDAERVVAIHTSRFFGYDGQVGDLDVYVNWDKFLQPGQSNLVGNHGYATELYVDLIEGDKIPQNNARDFDLSLLETSTDSIVDINTAAVNFSGITKGIFDLSQSNRLRLGTPTAGDSESYVEFTGLPFNTATNVVVPLGTLTYRNGLTESGTEPKGNLDFNLSLELNKPTSLSTSFNFTFNNIVTSNTTGDPVLDGDILRFASNGLSRDKIDTNGTNYTLELLGFFQNGNTKAEFNSPEQTTATATLFGQITIPDSQLLPPGVWEELRNIYAGLNLLRNRVFTLPRMLTPILGIEAIPINPPQILGRQKAEENQITQPEPFVITEELAAEFPGGVVGSNNNEIIFGSAVSDGIAGMAGADLLTGSQGKDLIRGGEGNDRVYGGKDNDILNGNQNNDFVSGDMGDDLIRGGKNNDTLEGGEGNDVLIGDLGTDRLTGGSGADIFIFRTDTGEETTDPMLADWILDFNSTEGDRIGINGGVSTDIITLTPADVNQDGTVDTIVQYIENNDILGTLNNIFGVVINTSPDVVKNAMLTVSIDEPILQIG
ncbi:choice-of-anchor K domain-containing protein [Laspinema olomoucense]|uniref:choice-of-anchor K domain-containing protein n=1 Tax=Laspinema olomoucense TaxID=3231600 RepID=UPI0021BACAD0|nr:choice-of-anchor K domain-containing protein [Laspinema sp. D3d]